MPHLTITSMFFPRCYRLGERPCEQQCHSNGMNARSNHCDWQLVEVELLALAEVAAAFVVAVEVVGEVGVHGYCFVYFRCLIDATAPFSSSVLPSSAHSRLKERSSRAETAFNPALSHWDDVGILSFLGELSIL